MVRTRGGDDQNSRKRKEIAAGKQKQGQSSRSGRQRGNPNNPFNFQDPNDIARYQVLCRRPIVPTRYLDDQFLENTGMTGDVFWLLENCGMSDFALMREPTYRSLTLEFLSSLYVDLSTPLGRIQFQLLGDVHVLTLVEFASIFSLPQIEDEQWRWIPVDPTIWDPDAFWKFLTADPELYNPSKSKCTLVRNPVYRYTQRILSCGMFGRGDSLNVMEEQDLYTLKGMCQNDVNVNPAALFANHLARVPTRSTGDIVVGGLITVIARYYGWDPSTHREEPVPGPMRLDIKAMENMRMCKLKQDGINWLYPNGLYMLLPHPFLNVAHLPNILFLPGIEDAFPGPPQAQEGVNIVLDDDDNDEDNNDLSHRFDEFEEYSRAQFRDLRSSVDLVRSENRTIIDNQTRIVDSQTRIEQNQSQMLDMMRAMQNWHLNYPYRPPHP